MSNITLSQFGLVSNAFSFAIAVMGAATAFLFLSRSQVAPKYKTAVTISGTVTLIAFYHYLRIAESWHGAYTITAAGIQATSNSFNDAYRYVDWLLTVPLLLVELILVMGLSREETVKQSATLATLAAVMVILGYPGEISSDAGTRWLWWFLSMIPFVIIVYKLVVGLGNSIASQPESVKELVSTARTLILLSWSFYPLVFVFPMIGITGGEATTAVQVGYTIADIVAKAAFGVFIYLIAVRKSEANI
jgi:bacteriorhodopsin